MFQSLSDASSAHHKRSELSHCQAHLHYYSELSGGQRRNLSLFKWREDLLSSSSTFGIDSQSHPTGESYCLHSSVDSLHD